MPNKQDQSNEEKLKIIRFVREQYFKYGFYKTSMSSIAAEMQISKKTIYKYFPSKEDLIEAVVLDFMGFVSGIIQDIFSQRKDAISKVAGFIELLGTVSSKINEPFLKDMRLHMPGLWRRIDEFRTNKMNTEIAKLIMQGKKEKLFIDYPNEIIMTMFVASIRSIVNPEFLLNNKFSYEQAARICIDIMFNGILTEKGKKIYNKSFIQVEK